MSVPDKDNVKIPLPEDIRVNGKIAQLVRRPRKSYKCHDCGLPTEVGEPYYTVTWAGSGLGSIKFPDHVCAGCIYQHLGIKKTYEERRGEWAAFLDWCAFNREELENTGRMKGLTLCLQKIWQDAVKLKEVR